MKTFLRDVDPSVILVCAWSIISIVIVGLSICLCHGHLIYTLDDPYIHLALADNLPKTYGINIGEPSSPSSSIIYPFLLALTGWAGLGSWGPLAPNLLSMGGAVFILGLIIENYILSNDKTKPTKKYILRYVIFGLIICSVMNAWGLVMTGMEHSLHVAMVMFILWRLLAYAELNKPPDIWFGAAIVLSPFIRFEGLALSIATIVTISFFGHRRFAIVSSTIIVSLFTIWYIFTNHLGLPWLPSSVLVKSDISASLLGQSGLIMLIKECLRNFYHSITGREGNLLLIGIAFVWYLSAKEWKQGNRRVVITTIPVILAGVAHVFFGHYGWFSRYEIYVVALITIYILTLRKVNLSDDHELIFTCVLLLIVAAPYILNTVRTPIASRGIYEQQYQMHRFVVDYWKKPVAVNDLGWVSYRNPNYVLDIWGLGSEEVRKLRASGNMNSFTLSSLVDKKRGNACNNI